MKKLLVFLGGGGVGAIGAYLASFPPAGMFFASLTAGFYTWGAYIEHLADKAG